MYPPGINAVPGAPAVYDCVTIPGSKPFARYVARVRCAPGDAGEAPFVPTDAAEGTKLVRVSPMKRTPEKDANERYASVPDDDDDDNTTYDGAASERTYGGGAMSERGAASRSQSRDEYMSPLSKYGYPPVSKQTTSPPQAPPGWAVGNTLTPKYTNYEVTARRHAALRAVASRRQEIAAFIRKVVENWDTETLIMRIEMQVGRDLQFIRINGTVVGGLVGLLIFSVSRWL